MSVSKTNEQAFEELIEKTLVGTSLEERQLNGTNDVDAQRPDSNQYYWGLPKDLDKKLAIDTRRLWSFLKATQQDVLDEYKGKDLESSLPKQLSKAIDTFGVIDVLRKGLEVENIKVDLFYPKPSASDSEIAKKKYAQNQFSITRQQVFSINNPGKELDMVLYVNGLPLFTFELKNPWTHQTAKYNGQKQYKEDRDPSEPILKYGRCLAHFTLDKDEIFFTTRLNKEKTFFMPFNKGLPGGQGTGNPLPAVASKTLYLWEEEQSLSRNVAESTMDHEEATIDDKAVHLIYDLNKGKNPSTPVDKKISDNLDAIYTLPVAGHKTSYLWEEVLQKDSVADIIMNYVLFDYDEAKTGKKVPHIMKNAKKLIFPRYHQLDVVNKLIDDVAECGVGKTYLIEHSAGSGKSNSLTWLAFKLIKTCPYSMEAVRAKALDKQLFDSVIVVTDRRLLDKQITDNIKAFGQSDKIIAHADNSQQLMEAIISGKKIIITTIQKFPFICDSIADVSDHNFAIIIDEAHSSQSGIAADKLNATVQKDADTEGGDTDALLEKLMKDRKMSTNSSYFAFTATPKKETLERFGTCDENGKFQPFHLYSMKQAIEEGFILNVLTNYTTYKGYYELTKSIEENPEYQTERAQKLLRKAVERNPQTIAAKADVMLTHFDSKIYRNHKLRGKAKAMVVTKDIECAILYYQALQNIAQEKKMPFNILIAFSGIKEIEGREYTESRLNGFPDSKTAEEFDKDENRILVVANKYLTGFDQPKLCAMYIDKPLDGVLAVQALSRLNRAAPNLGKLSEDLFILDFYNTKEGMKNAFDPFYTMTTLSEPTDVNVLHDLKNTLLAFGVFDMDEIRKFMDMYIHGVSADKWSPIIDKAADRFNLEIEWAENGKADFKMKCKQFVKIYSRVAAIMDYEMKDWEMLFWFLRFLIPGLKVDPNGGDSIRDLLDSVDLNTYGLRRTALNETIELDSDETTLDPNKAVMVNAGGQDEPETDTLDDILKEFNERWFNGWEATPEDQRTKIVSITQAILEDEDYNDLVVGNPDEQAVNKAMISIIDRIIRQKRKSDMSLYKEYNKNGSFKESFRNVLIKMLGEADYSRTLFR